MSNHNQNPETQVSMRNSHMFKSEVNQNVYTFNGSCKMLENRLSQLSRSDQIYSANIQVRGDKIKENNKVCLICTILWGAIFLFPLFFMCCDWWKKKVNPAYSIPTQAYQSLKYLTSRSDLKSLSLVVKDNTFDQERAKILYDLLQKSKINSFQFVNSAENYDFYQRQYKNFDQNMKPIKKLNMSTQFSWSRYE